MTSIQVTYCGMSGSGPTVKLAKQDAVRKIESVLDADFTPAIFHCRDAIGIVWRTPFGVNSAYLSNLPAAKQGTLGSYGTRNDDFDAACREVRLNLAQITADIDSDIIPDIIATDAHLTRSFLDWLGFQRAYLHAKATLEGSDHTWHTWACHNSQQFIPKAA